MAGDFLSTSEFIHKLNTCIQSVFEGDFEEDGSSSIPRFELRSRFSDGTTRLLDDSEREYADYKFKIGQAAQAMTHLSPQERVEWAESRRKFGNNLFSQDKFKEAMDVYITCLVALDQGHQTLDDTKNELQKANDHDDDDDDDDNDDIHVDSSLLDEQIKLPILLNLSACMLKLGMYQKTEKICSLCLETVAGSRTNPKIFFRRGRARAFMGSFQDAREDYHRALNLLSSEKDSNFEIQNVQREISKLDLRIQDARRNHVRQKKAMKILLGGNHSDLLVHDDPIHSCTLPDDQRPTPLYLEMSKVRAYSKLRAKETFASDPMQHSIESCTASKKNGSFSFAISASPTFLQLWKQSFLLLLARFIKAILSWLGDDSVKNE